MVNDTPHGWLERAAEHDPDSPALFLEEGVVSYRDLHDQVVTRRRSLQGVIESGSIVPAVMRLDLASVVEMLAIMGAGGVLLPYTQTRPRVPSHTLEGMAVCIPTSGSTGDPRLVPLTFGNIAASVRASRDRLGTGPDDRWLATLPLDHVGGLSVLWRCLEAGGAAVLAPFSRSLVGMIDVTGPTVASLVPTMVHRLLDWSPDSLVSIGRVLTGGAGTSPTLVSRARDYGASLVVTYGLTEASSQVATALPGTAQTLPTVVGPPLAGFSVRIIGPSGELTHGEHGRIEIDGPAVFGGYLGQPRRSEPYLTSDIGFLLEDGSLGVVGRADDIVVVGGRNVSIAALRDVILATDGVIDAVVVGMSDPEWGSVPAVIVELEPLCAIGDVRAAVEDRVPHGHAPHRWITSKIPLLSNGKHDRPAARRFLAAR